MKLQQLRSCQPTTVKNVSFHHTMWQAYQGKTQPHKITCKAASFLFFFNLLSVSEIQLVQVGDASDRK